MIQTPIIKKILAGLLLVVFSFSIAPKKLLHDVLARHKDKEAAPFSGWQSQLNHSGFICKCDNLVAESPFTHDPVYFIFNPLPVFAVQQDSAICHYYASTFFFFELRGPPAV